MNTAFRNKMSLKGLFIFIASFLFALQQLSADHEFVVDSRHHWRSISDIVQKPERRPSNLLTIRDFVHRRGAVRHNIPKELDNTAQKNEYDVDYSWMQVPVEDNSVVRTSGIEAPIQTVTPDSNFVINAPYDVTPASIEIYESKEKYFDGVNESTVENAFAKHLVRDVVTGFEYFKSLFSDASEQADVIADRYLEIEEDGWNSEPNVIKKKHLDGEDADIESSENLSASEESEKMLNPQETHTPQSTVANEVSCLQQLSRCHALDRSSFGRRAETDVLDEARGKQKKKFLKKILLPLLLSYKLKFFTLIPVLISGLILLVGSTGLAGFFFALFSAVITMKNSHEH